MSIEKNITNWIKANVPAGTRVIKAPYEGARPTQDYITYQVLTVIPQGNSFDTVRTLKVSGLIDETKKFNATMMVSINAYTPKGYAWLNALHASAEYWETHNLLSADSIDVSLVGMNRQANLTGLGDEGYRARQQGDFDFYLTTENVHEIHRLSEFIITGKWSEDAGGDIEFSHEVKQAP